MVKTLCSETQVFLEERLGTFIIWYICNIFTSFTIYIKCNKPLILRMASSKEHMFSVPKCSLWFFSFKYCWIVWKTYLHAQKVFWNFPCSVVKPFLLSTSNLFTIAPYFHISFTSQTIVGGEVLQAILHYMYSCINKKVLLQTHQLWFHHVYLEYHCVSSPVFISYLSVDSVNIPTEKIWPPLHAIPKSNVIEAEMYKLYGGSVDHDVQTGRTNYHSKKTTISSIIVVHTHTPFACRATFYIFYIW